MAKGQRPFSLSNVIASATERALVVGGLLFGVPALLLMQQESGSGSGGQGETENGNDTAGSESGGGSDDSSSSGSESQDKEEEEEPTTRSSSNTVSKEEYDRVLNRMKAADKRASDNEEKVKEYERQQQSELEQAQSDLQETQKTNESLQGQVVELEAEIAFLKNDKHKFKNQKAALKLARDYFDDYSDDDGNIDMDAVVKKVANDYPELLQTEEEGGGKTASGAPLKGGNNSGDSGRIDKQKLRQKYSALRR